MTFDTEQLEILYRARILGVDRGQVLVDWATGAADELVEHGWLERRALENGDTGYWWTTTAETAIELHALTQDANDRQN